MSRCVALLILLVLWAGLFLPALGTIEVKGGEEGRRILPAIAMLESGNWIVPYVGGRPYLRKPPLLNWVIAGSFALTGQRTEWTARLPSALAVFALVAVFVGVGSRWLTPTGALLAGLFAMTNLGMLEKGRLAEIEALYTTLTGAALVCWLAWWRDGRSPWLIWLVPSVLLGFGLLAKGPLLLLFFYAVVVCVLWQARRLRELRRAPCLLGVVLMVSIFALWAVPYFRQVAELNAGHVWQKEFAGRVGHRAFGLWLEEIWNHFENLLPWLLFAPLWWSRRILATFSAEDAAIFRGLRAAVLLCAAALFFTPGVAARYTLPLIVPVSLLNALVLSRPELLPRRLLSSWRLGLIVLFSIVAICAVALPWIAGARLAVFLTTAAIVSLAAVVIGGRKYLVDPLRLAAASGAAIVAGVFLFAVVQVPRVVAAESARPLARGINQALGDAREVYVIDPGYRPSLFYLEARCIYLLGLRDLPPQPGFALLRGNAEGRLSGLGRDAQILGKFPERGEKDLLLIRFGAASPSAPAGERSSSD